MSVNNVRGILDRVQKHTTYSFSPLRTVVLKVTNSLWDGVGGANFPLKISNRKKQDRQVLMTYSTAFVTDPQNGDGDAGNTVMIGILVV